ncbi:MAG: efflux RND transporter permease subunit [Myxococcales bacterium]|nr:efflux RND transporter permease subunit [Myxococcales bacterium]
MAALDWLIAASVRNKLFVLVGTVVFIGAGVLAFHRLVFDAFPDLTNVQVQVLTSTPGMASEEVEKLVTVPVERSLSGLPGLSQMRSLSRIGVSAITVVFEDGTDIWLARQLVKERLDLARSEIPESAGTPELAPPSTGLGEIFQFTLTSDRHSRGELDRIFQRDVAPRLRAVPGVVEVNAWGGGAAQLDVRLDPFALATRSLTLSDVQGALSSSLGLVSGGALQNGAEQRLVRAVANPASPAALESVVIEGERADAAIRLGDIARVDEGSALTVGLGSADAHGEAIFVMVQLLAGADALSVVRLVRERAADVAAALPDGIELDVVYDREKLVGSTLTTVTWSLLEGGALVIIVLLLLLGDLRAGLLVASVIPLSMLGAFTGLYLIGYSGNLMSLGAVDFGLIVDGTIVVTESIVALSLARRGDLGAAVVERAQKVGKPVLFSVGILMLVYVPVLLMWGTEGKLFRPMAMTVLFALLSALVLSFTYVPAMAALVLRPSGEHHTWITRSLARLYRPMLDACLSRPAVIGLIALALVGVSGVIGSKMGVEFVPQLQEGDIVIQTQRLPSLSPDEALQEATRIEKIVATFPEVERVASRSGSPAVATDPMGLEQADILVRLAPRKDWTTAKDTAGLVSAIEERLTAEAPGAAFNFSQPIEMRFNELLQGITSDVGIKLYGQDLDALLVTADRLATVLEAIPGAADVRRPTLEGVTGVDVRVRPESLERYGLDADSVLTAVTALQRGQEVGRVFRGAFRDPVVVTIALPRGVQLEDLPLVLPSGESIPLGEVADVRTVETPAIVQREGGTRRVVVEANVRGRDIGSFVVEAQEKLADVQLGDGMWTEWSGKYEQLKAAGGRTAVTVPAVLFVIVGVLYVMFGRWRPALLIFMNVPVAASGGVLALHFTGLPISMSAIVGFIALFGVAVMNGIVLLSRTRELHEKLPSREAARASALERFRPVLLTACVAGIGFVPMALSTGVGAEVQRPLATVVIGGLVTATILTLLVLPALYGRLCRSEDGKVGRQNLDVDDDESVATGAPEEALSC